jgi:hypothetical protein
MEEVEAAESEETGFGSKQALADTQPHQAWLAC